ncbi:DUF2680 domain-containing protein [Salinibacillus xinjiangensis]|uniref:DUF2680 domain-containing protein n=1 Tax=Salinibacillus xinjiangensis TaxID=1229268 RepID=A0A6G1X5W0_9BACI|nr:DUF2680 domain-containing protein [Salinibacillus xinjiangensis]MRG86327.1 DUF2680 domain-containing protein [Salinibacillus xinjiangensis]
MRKFLLFSFAFFLTLGSLGIQVSAEADGEAEPTNVELNEQQTKELETLHNEMFELHKQLINKYVEFGVISQEKADMKLAKMEKHQEKLKENGYIPHCDHKKREMKDEADD